MIYVNLVKMKQERNCIKMNLKNKTILLADMAALLMNVDREIRFMDTKKSIKTNNLGGFRKANIKSENHDVIKTKKRRTKNKLAKASRKKNRKHQASR